MIFRQFPCIHRPHRSLCTRDGLALCCILGFPTTIDIMVLGTVLEKKHFRMDNSNLRGRKAILVYGGVDSSTVHSR